MHEQKTDSLPSSRLCSDNAEAEYSEHSSDGRGGTVLRMYVKMPETVVQKHLLEIDYKFRFLLKIKLNIKYEKKYEGSRRQLACEWKKWDIIIINVKQ